MINLVKVMQQKFTKDEILTLKKMLNKYLVCHSYYLASVDLEDQFKKNDSLAIGYQVSMSKTISASAIVHDDLIDLLEAWEDNEPKKKFFNPKVTERLQ